MTGPSKFLDDIEMTDRTIMYENIPNDVDLITVKTQAEELQKRQRNITYSNHILRKMKYNRLDWYRFFQPDKFQAPPPEGVDTKVKEPNVVLTVQVHKPFYAQPTGRMTMSETYLVLGTNSLCDLRDAIKCANDLAVAGELSNTPDFQGLACAKDIYKSGFFFIEGTFYNDMRQVDNRDYSETIMKWIREGNRSERIGSFNKAKMEECTFNDLDIVVGKPYFYQHQGDCEHLLVFTDVRLFHPMDPQDIRSYPYLLREMNRKRKVCKACSVNTAGWIVYNCSLAPSNPMFMCHRCFKAFLYDKDGNKIGNFEAYKSAEHPA